MGQRIELKMAHNHHAKNYSVLHHKKDDVIKTPSDNTTQCIDAQGLKNHCEEMMLLFDATYNR